MIEDKYIYVEFVRLAPTTLHKAPDCYGFARQYNMNGCTICPVFKECKSGNRLETWSIKVFNPNIIS